jgi:hypothetical protein
MAIGLGLLRAVGRGRRAGRVEEDQGPARSTVREICLIGLDRRASGEDWNAGQEVAWLGRTYRVVATAGDAEAGSGCAAARCYVHLSHGDGD